MTNKIYGLKMASEKCTFTSSWISINSYSWTFSKSLQSGTELVLPIQLVQQLPVY